MEMTVTDLRANIGKFGLIKAKYGEALYGKDLHGHIKDMDSHGTVWFVDNDGYGYAFKSPNIDSFEEKEFEPLPEEHKGKELHYEGGKLMYKGTHQEVDLRK